MDEAELQISDLEDKIMENNESDKRGKQREKITLPDLENTVIIKKNNIRIIGVPEDEERKKGAEGLCEQITVENFPNLRKDTNIKIQEAQRTPIRFNKN